MEKKTAGFVLRRPVDILISGWGEYERNPSGSFEKGAFKRENFGNEEQGRRSREERRRTYTRQEKRIEIRKNLHIMNIALQDIVFPRSCPVCGKVTKNGADICPDCEKELREIGSQVCHKCGQPVAGAADMWCPACAKSLRGEEFLRYRLPEGTGRGNSSRYKYSFQGQESNSFQESSSFSETQGRYGEMRTESQGVFLSAGGKEHYFSQARSLYRYNGPMRQSIYRLKYKNAKEYAIYYGRKMAEHVADGAFEATQTSRAVQTVYDAIIPVPMYRKKQKKRGYNQAELLATEMGYRLGIPVRKNYLLRVRETAPMKELSRSERRKNLKEAFAVRKTGQPTPKSVLLVDDIFTTGATADACAHALRLDGIHRIDCLCLAREDLSV
ncbi:MAG: ComF family protein [Lachnospiraceae bacterium]|nr:ComF family protein [Lachnospiraceae bacterium]